MKDYFKFKTWIILAVLLVVGLGISFVMVSWDFRNIKDAKADFGVTKKIDAVEVVPDWYNDDSMIKIDDTHYLSVYVGNNPVVSKGYAVVLRVENTTDITRAGDIAEIESDRFGANAIVQIDDTHFLVTYARGGLALDGVARVLTVDKNNWSISPGQDFKFENDKYRMPSLIKMDDNHYFTVYWDGVGLSNFKGHARIINVSDVSDGLVISSGDDLVFEEVGFSGSSLVQVDGDGNFLVVYKGTDNDGFARVLQVKSDWSIDSGDAFEFELNNCSSPVLSKIDEANFLVAYSGVDLVNGMVRIIRITDVDAGAIVNVGAPLKVFSGYLGEGSMVRVDEAHFLWTYTGGDWHGFANVLQIDMEPGNETISTVGENIEFETGIYWLNSLVKINSTNFLTTYGGGDSYSGHAVILNVVEFNEETIYYSVGDTDNPLYEGMARSDGGIMTLLESGGSKIGVGDEIKFEPVTDARYYVSRKLPNNKFAIQNSAALSGTPGAKPLDFNREIKINRAFGSLSEAEAGAEDSNHLGTNELALYNYNLNIACYGGIVDTTPVVIEGWDTNENSYIRIYTPTEISEVSTSQRHDGKWDDDAYRLEPSVPNPEVALKIRGVAYVQVEGLQIKIDNDNVSAIKAVSIELVPSLSAIKINNNIIQGVNTDSSAFSGIVAFPDDANNYIWNNVVYGFKGDNGSKGIQVNKGTNYIYNNTVSDCYYGIYQNGSANNYIKNNVVFNNTQDFYGYSNYDEFENNASDDDRSVEDLKWIDISDPLECDPESNCWGDNFVEHSNGDFHIKDFQSVLHNTGLNLSADPGLSFSNDIDGIARDAFWDVGADEHINYNIHGFGWSEHYGWISFNFADCDIDEDGNFEGTPLGCPTSGRAVPYGLSINDKTGFLSGYAWSNNVGWISFQENDLPDADYIVFSAECENTECVRANNCTACINRSRTGAGVYGWGKVLAFGEEGWLRLDDLDSGVEHGLVIERSSKEFEGWAWNGSSVDNTGAGWISFNCENEIGATVDEDDDCINYPNYYVWADINWPPEAIDLMSPNLTNRMACYDNDVLQGFLSWTFEDSDDDSQSAYRIVVDDDADIENIGNPGDALLDTEICTQARVDLNYDGDATNNNDCLYNSDVQQYIINNIIKTYATYGEKLYWGVEVWDNYGLSSGLVQFDEALGHTDTNLISEDAGGLELSYNDNDDNAFMIPLHEFPESDPSYFLPDPSAEEKVQFVGTSKYYEDYTNVEKDCDLSCAWDWTANPSNNVNFYDPYDIATIDSTGSSTIAIFNQRQLQQEIILDVTDSSGYSCSTSTTLNVKYKLPSWIEVK